MSLGDDERCWFKQDFEWLSSLASGRLGVGFLASFICALLSQGYILISYHQRNNVKKNVTCQPTKKVREPED